MSAGIHIMPIIQTMTAYHPKEDILGVRYGKEGAELVRISRADLTCWNLFRRVFRCGPLARTDFKLTQVTTFLSGFKAWQVLPERLRKEVYPKLYALGNEALLKGNAALFQQMSIKSKVVLIECLSANKQVRSEREVHWNPLLQVKHLKAQIAPASTYYALFMRWLKGQKPLAEDNRLISEGDFNKYNAFTLNTENGILTFGAEGVLEATDYDPNDPPYVVSY